MWRDPTRSPQATAHAANPTDRSPVIESARDADGFRFRDLKPSGGFGLRYRLVERQRINLRLDFGFARREPTPSVYLNLLEAF